MKYNSTTHISEIGLAAPAVRALEGAGIKMLKDAVRIGDAKLASLHGFGPGAQKRLGQALMDAGLRSSVKEN